MSTIGRSGGRIDPCKTSFTGPPPDVQSLNRDMGQRGLAALRSCIAGCALAAILLGLLAGGAAAAAPPAGPAADLALALRFRPHLFFDSQERWRPLDVDAFLAEHGHRVCPRGGGGALCSPLLNVAQLTPAVAYLDLRGSELRGGDAKAPDLATCARSRPSLFDCDEGGRSVIYAHVTRTPTRIALDYWWFLRFNALTPDWHEGDWEGVTVIVDAAGTQVTEVHYAAHKGVWRYRPGVVRVVDGHALVEIAHGTHAAYPRPCADRPCLQTGALAPEGRFDGKDRWVGNAATGCHRLCVRLLPVTAAGAPASWDAWLGRWGRPRLPPFPPPLTPAFQGRYLHPFLSTPTTRHSF